MAHDVFVSYSSKDKTVADAVCAVLEARGTRCWIAPRDVRPGMPYGEAIIEAIHGASVMVLVFSSHANASGHIPKEVERAVSSGLTIIPLRIEDVVPASSLDYFISSVHWLDAMTPPLEQHLEELARTVQAILPKEVRNVPGETLKRTHASVAVTRQPGMNSGKNKLAVKPAWIVGAALIALIFVGTLFLRNAPQETRVSEGISTTDEKPSQPLPANSSQPMPERPSRPSPNRVSPPERPVTQNSRDVTSIEGCWSWLNNASLTVRDNGTVATGPFTGRWQLVDSGRRTYTFTWPKAVDNVELSADGNSMKGGNQYGFAMSATRGGGGGAPGNLVGIWQWFNGVTIFINANGTLQAGPLVAQWQPTDARGRTFAITWPEPVDTLTLSPDGTSLSGGNQFGVAVGGKKTTCPGQN